MDDSSLKQALDAAMVHLARFLDPQLAATRLEMARALEPHPDDYARVFKAEVAEQARTGYQGLWQNLPDWPVRPEQTQLRVSVASSQEFAEDSPRSLMFPGGYRTIAHHLIPDRIWICWEFIAAHRDMGVSFDGLVPLEGRWAWFPKPWKVLPQAKVPTPLSHYSE